MGHPGKFQRVLRRVLVSLLHRRRSPEVNQTLHDAWPSPALVHYVYILGGSCPLKEFCQVQNSPFVQVLRSLNILAALLHGTSAAGVSQTLRRGTRNGITELSQWAAWRHLGLYSAGWPSRWVADHILVVIRTRGRLPTPRVHKVDNEWPTDRVQCVK